jgi:ribonucleoside-diphosphate reductase alpha chain
MRRYLDDEIDRPYPKQQNLTELEEAEAKAMNESPEADGGATTAPATDADDTADLLAAGESPECPDCGSMSLYYSEGCKTCESCGWSEC